MKLGMISLGCSKNQIDTELFLGVAQKYNIEITNEIEDADILVVNTCGFIESAKKEAIDTILEMAEYKEQGKIVIAMGCLVERYLDSLKESMPEVDYFIPIKDYKQIDRVFKQITSSNESYLFDYTNRMLTTLPHSAYIRIAEGCNNRCSYCAIPLIRGNFVSRPLNDILEEAKVLVNNGAKELTVIAQDTTRYGTDLKENGLTEDLLLALSNIEGVEWVRILYLYPDEVTDELLNVMTNSEKIVPYFDLPLQHASDNMLKAMNRRGMKKDIYELINKIRNIPHSILRTTFIVGFPGETNEDYNELKDFIQEIKFDRVGIFTYSDEEDTPGYLMEPKIKPSLMKKRYNELMKIQNSISLEKNKSLVGKTIKVLIDYYDFDKEAYVARSYAYAPDDVDGCIYIKATSSLIVGEFYEATIIKATSYDLYGIIK